MNSKIKKYHFYHRFIRILSFFPLVTIPCLIIVLIYNFNIYGMLGMIAISIFIGFICFWDNWYRIELYDDKMIYYGFRKHIFEYRKIHSLIVEKHGYIQLEYDKKVYRIAGFITPLTGWYNEEKNINLVNEINDICKKIDRR